MICPLAACLLIPVLLGAPAAQEPPDAGTWPDYRGPTHDGHSPATGLPDRWSETESVAWKTRIHGRAWSSPVVADGEIWLTTATEDGHELFVLAVELESGEIVHDERLFEIEEPQFAHEFNSYASPSPVIDGRRVGADQAGGRQIGAAQVCLTEKRSI